MIELHEETLKLLVDQTICFRYIREANPCTGCPYLESYMYKNVCNVGEKKIVYEDAKCKPGHDKLVEGVEGQMKVLKKATPESEKK